MKIGTITKPTDIRREMSSDTIPFLNNIWKKEQYIEYTNYFIDKNTGYLTNPENKSDQLSVSSGLILSDGESIGQCDFEPIEKSKNGSTISSDKTELLNVAWDTYEKGDYEIR